jgi:hypothetical protein
VVDDVTGLGQGRWWSMKGLDYGQESWRRVSGEESTMTRRLQGGLNDCTGSAGEVDDGAGSREIFGWKFWQPDGVCESLWRLGFAKAAQWFIYRRITVATGISDVSRAIAIENHSSNDHHQPVANVILISIAPF